MEGDNLSTAKKIGEILKSKSWTIATAESCTAGGISNALARVEGASAYLKGGVVSYTNEIKQKILWINPQVIEMYDVVSMEVAKDMAASIRNLYNTDVGIGITGYVGQTGGNKKVPNGTVWISVICKGVTNTVRYNVSGSRNENIDEMIGTALDLILETLEIAN